MLLRIIISQSKNLNIQMRQVLFSVSLSVIIIYTDVTTPQAKPMNIPTAVQGAELGSSTDREQFALTDRLLFVHFTCQAHHIYLCGSRFLLLRPGDTYAKLHPLQSVLPH